MNSEVKYQIFISSTYKDLIQARNEAINTVLESYNFPVGMEYFGADNDEQWTIIKDLIDSSDYYILILGHRYGSISKQDGISFTEKEFDYALERGVKLLCFVRNTNVSTLPHERDEDPDIKDKLAKFRAKVLDNRLCEFWDDVSDLKNKISNSLYKNIRKHGGIGWVRGNQVSGFLAEEMAKLSEENRKLREENENLKKVTNTKMPLLKFSINNITNIPFNETDELELFWYKLREDYYYKQPLIITKKNNQENSYSMNLISIGMPNINRFIDEYNREVESITESRITQHNNALRDFFQIEKYSLQLKIFIDNSGETLANKLSIEIKFPDFIKIIDDDASENIKSYKNNLETKLIPEVKKPEERQNNYLSGGAGIKIHNIRDLMNPLKLNKNVYTSKNVIHIFEDSLLHSRHLTFDNFTIVPRSVGEGAIHVNIMCAEYSEAVTFSFPIRVTE